MRRFSEELREYGRNVFTNWSSSDLPVGQRSKVFVRNRTKAVLKGCCGNHGQPGC